MSTPEPAAPLGDEAPKKDLPFDKDDLTYGPDDVVENSDADPAKDDESPTDWTDEGGATDHGPATHVAADD